MYHGVRVQDSHHRRSRRRPRGCAESRPDATPGGPKAGSHRPRIERETDVVDITAGATANLSALPYSRTADDPKTPTSSHISMLNERRIMADTGTW